MSQHTLPQHALNPVPFGLFGFALNSILFAGSNLGLYSFNSTLFAAALLLGGLAQGIAARYCAKQGDTFGLTSFGGYALYWWSLLLVINVPLLNPNWLPDNNAIAAYNGVWAVFTMQLGWLARKLSISDQIIFACLAVIYLALTAHAVTAISGCLILAGIAGAVAGVTGLVAAQQLLAKSLQKKVLPSQ
ncbi:acetate uptake transporter [Pseudoalteromonas fenneropenaei]|uniref:Acetate uptake transporter n=1 Tax=Pseudoalteromonas fenneropenaei TaxID=1737459 RepID=A0ABV7CK22_9GAMM